jgi:hypothetical protein
MGVTDDADDGVTSPRSRTAFDRTIVWDALAGAAVALLILLAIGGPLVLSGVGVESLTVGTPGTFTYLFSFTNTPTEISLGVGPAILGVGALLGLAYVFGQSYRRVGR